MHPFRVWLIACGAICLAIGAPPPLPRRRLAASASPATQTVITSPLTLTSGTYAYAGPLVITSTLTVIGTVTIVAPSLTLVSGATITGVGGGWPAQTGPPPAPPQAAIGPCYLTSVFPYAAEGGSHGGCAARNHALQACDGSGHSVTYGDAFSPTAQGCGGTTSQYIGCGTGGNPPCCTVGAAGGASLTLNVSGVLVVNGTISVDGASPGAGTSICYEAGGGLRRAASRWTFLRWLAVASSPHAARLAPPPLPPQAAARAARCVSPPALWATASVP